MEQGKTESCGRHACLEHYVCVQRTAKCGCPQCKAAVLRCAKLNKIAADTPAPDPRRLHESDAQTRERIKAGSVADVAARAVRAGFDPGEVARVNAITRPGLDPTTDAIAAQNEQRASWRADVARLTKEIAELRLHEDRFAAANQRGVEMWREAHPDNGIAFPDHATLVVWLLEQLDAAVTEADNARASAGIEADLRNKLDAWKSAGEDWGKRFKAKVAENEALQRRLDELIKQRDFHEGRFNEANHRHAQASSALEVMTIKWLELGNETKRILRELNGFAEQTARMMPLCKAAQDWEMAYASDAISMPYAHADLAGAVDTYQKACAQAADKNEQIPASEPASK